MLDLFTGIIQELGVLEQKKKGSNDFQLTIGAQKITADLSRGESVAVNGVCLTVVEFADDYFIADVMPETVKKTNLGQLNRGDQLNLELPMTADRFFGGHLVTGHIDGQGWVKSIDRTGNARLLTLDMEDGLEKYLVSKGSVALNGVSLTIVELEENSLTVSLIPETWEQTNFNVLQTGHQINIETDIIGKYIVKMIENNNLRQEDSSNISKEFLQENGFL